MFKTMFEDAYYILFPKPSRKYNRDRLGKFSIKQMPVVFIGDTNWKQLIAEHTQDYD